MLTKVPCPYCYRRINPARLSYQCMGKGVPGKPGCGKSVDRVRADATGYAIPALPSFPTDRRLGSARRAPCPVCSGPTGARVCPECHTPLPAGFERSRSPLVGMVGGKGAGKTVYLAVLNHELHNSMADRFDADIQLCGDLQPVGSTVAPPLAWVDNYEKALFDDKTLPEGTSTAIDGRRAPLVLEWRQLRSTLGVNRYATTVLSFYDAAGEDFVTQESTYAQTYLGVADSMIVLLDPWQLPGARHAIDVPEAALVGAEKPIDVLKRITELLRAETGTSTTKLLKTPLAVVFAKMDALLTVLDADDPLLQAPPARAGYDEQAGQDTHEQVRALLDRFGGNDIDKHLRLNYKSFRYFAVSALGAPPNYRTGRVDERGVRPLRVDEPLLWLLSELGVVDRIGP